MSEHPPAVELTAADELAHPPGEERLWGESWYFDFTDREGTLGGYVRLGLYPNLGVAWYWACLVGEGRPLVTVIDHEVALPKAPSLEIRADGLWADHVVETPFDHMTLGCEAFAVAVDDPAEVYGDLRGDRVPFGFDLEWETDRGGLYPWIGTTRYEVSCNVHGEILVGDETIELRRHRAARPQLGRARLVEPRLGVDRRRPRGRHAVPHRPDPRARPGGVRARATCCRPMAACEQIDVCTAERGARRARVPHDRGEITVRPARAWPSSRATSARCTWSTRPRRHPPRPLPPGAVPLRDRRRALRGRLDGVEPTGDLTSSEATLRRAADAAPPRTLVDVFTATAAAYPEEPALDDGHGAVLCASSSARSTRSPRRIVHAGVGRGQPGRRPHGVGHQRRSTSPSSPCSTPAPPTCPSMPTTRRSGPTWCSARRAWRS